MVGVFCCLMGDVLFGVLLILLLFLLVFVSFVIFEHESELTVFIFISAAGTGSSAAGSPLVLGCCVRVNSAYRCLAIL